MARIFTPPKATGPSTNKKATPPSEKKQETAEKPAGGTQKPSDGDKE